MLPIRSAAENRTAAPTGWPVRFLLRWSSVPGGMAGSGSSDCALLTDQRGSRTICRVGGLAPRIRLRLSALGWRCLVTVWMRP